jgi:acyl-CoA synthetase (AMP-forming)/AMP-acid ligase II
MIPDVAEGLRALHNPLAAAAGFARMVRDFSQLQPDARFSAARLIERRAHETPHVELLRFAGHSYSCADVQAESSRWARLLRARGIAAGECVALLLNNGPSLLFALAGLNRLGAPAALLHPALPAASLASCLAAVPARAVVVESALRPALEAALAQLQQTLPVWEVRGDSPGQSALPLPEFEARLRSQAGARIAELEWPASSSAMAYLFTSGTSGPPKAAVVTNLRFLVGGSFMGRSLAEAGPADTIYCALPLCHNTALSGGWAAALVTGAKLVLRERFSASGCLADIRRERATVLLYIGELCRYLLAQPARADDRDHCLRSAVGVGMREQVWREFQQRFAVPSIREMYGATEGNAAIANYAGRPGMLGQLSPGQLLVAWDALNEQPLRDARGRCVPVRVGETGLLLARITPRMRFDGYLDEAASQRKILRDVRASGDRWFDSGDLLRLHAGRWVSFVDRSGDSFRWKGENVASTEVAASLERMPGISEALVFGAQIPGCEGRAGMACVVADGALDLAALARRLDAELAPYQRPLLLRQTESILTTATFKQLTRIYREQAWDPRQVSDPLWIRSGASFRRLDAQLYEHLQRRGLSALEESPS